MTLQGKDEIVPVLAAIRRCILKNKSSLRITSSIQVYVKYWVTFPGNSQNKTRNICLIRPRVSYNRKTRKHSSRMRTGCVPPVIYTPSPDTLPPGYPTPWKGHGTRHNLPPPERTWG